MEPDRARPGTLVIGATGQLGSEVVRALGDAATIAAPPRSELDLARPASIRATLRRLRPSVVVNAAAFTDVDRAETERDECFAVNGEAPRVLAEEVGRLGALLVHFSTDYVFDGRAAAAYVETDSPAPLNVYGESKLAGERAIADVDGAWLVIRTSWVYGLHGRNFFRTMLRLMGDRGDVRVVDDQVGAPTWSRSVATATVRAIEVLASADWEKALESSGVYHVASSGFTSWCGFARAIARRVDIDGVGPRPLVTPISSGDYAARATRPRWSVLDSSKFARHFGMRLRAWESDLAEVMAPSIVPAETSGR